MNAKPWQRERLTLIDEITDLKRKDLARQNRIIELERKITEHCNDSAKLRSKHTELKGVAKNLHSKLLRASSAEKDWIAAHDLWYNNLHKTVAELDQARRQLDSAVAENQQLKTQVEALESEKAAHQLVELEQLCQQAKVAGHKIAGQHSNLAKHPQARLAEIGLLHLDAEKASKPALGQTISQLLETAQKLETGEQVGQLERDNSQLGEQLAERALCKSPELNSAQPERQASIGRQPVKKGRIIEVTEKQVINLWPPLFVYGCIGSEVLLSTERTAHLANQPSQPGIWKGQTYSRHKFALVESDQIVRALHGATSKYSFPAWPKAAPSEAVAWIQDNSGTVQSDFGAISRQLAQLEGPSVKPRDWPSEFAQLTAELAAARLEAEQARANFAQELQRAQELLAEARLCESNLKRDNEWLQCQVGGETESEEEQPERRTKYARLAHPFGDQCRVPGCGRTTSCYWRPNNYGKPEYGERICEPCYQRRRKSARPSKSPRKRKLPASKLNPKPHPEGGRCLVNGCGAESSSFWRRNTGDKSNGNFLCNTCWHTWRNSLKNK